MTTALIDPNRLPRSVLRRTDGSWEIDIEPTPLAAGDEVAPWLGHRVVLELRRDRGRDLVVAIVDDDRLGVAPRSVVPFLVPALAGGPVSCLGFHRRPESATDWASAEPFVLGPPGLLHLPAPRRAPMTDTLPRSARPWMIRRMVRP